MKKRLHLPTIFKEMYKYLKLKSQFLAALKASLKYNTVLGTEEV